MSTVDDRDVHLTDGALTKEPWTPEPPYQSYPEFLLYLQMLKYTAGVIIVLGVVGNLLTLLVLQGPAYRSSPSRIVLSALAVSDLGYIVCGLFRHWIIGLTDFRLDIRNLNIHSCMGTVFTTYFFKHCSSCLLALVTLERMFSVLYPLRCKEIVTKKNMGAAVSMLTLAICGVNISHFFVHDLKPNARIVCTSRPSAKWFFENVYYWIDALLSNIIPFCIIFICNMVIIYKLTLARARRNVMTSNKDSEKKTNSTTVMLMVVGVVFLLTTTPKAIYYFGYGYNVWPRTSNAEFAKLYLAYIVTTLLVFVNSGINFILYCLTGTKFRQAFLGTFCRGRKDGKEKKTNTNITPVTNISSDIN